MFNINKTKYSFYNEAQLKPVFINKHRKQVDNIHDTVMQKGYLPISNDSGLVYDKKNRVFVLLKREGDVLSYTDVVRCIMYSNRFTLLVPSNLDNSQMLLCIEMLNKALCLEHA